MPSIFINTVLENLQLLNQHPNGRIVIICGEYWAVLHSLDVPTRALCEISSNKYLPERCKITSAQIDALKKLSYSQRRRQRSLGKLVAMSTSEQHEQCAAELNYIFEDILLTPCDQAKIHFHPNARNQLQNKELIKTMKEASKNRQQGVRFALYRALLNSRLLLLVEKEGATVPMQTGTIAKFPIFTCFTDYEAARCYDPKVGWLYETYAFEIFTSVRKLNVGTLQINPKGDIGGDLYQNEIDTLLQAVNKAQ